MNISEEQFEELRCHLRAITSIIKAKEIFWLDQIESIDGRISKIEIIIDEIEKEHDL